MESNSKSAVAMVTASGTKKGPMKHKFARIEIHPAANGFTIKHHPPMEESAKKDSDGFPRYMPPPDPTESVFSGNDATQQVLDHIGSIMGKGKAPGNKSDKTKSGKMDADDKKGEKENEGAGDKD